MNISTRSVFVRDPKELFLGLFLDKVVQTEHLYERCCINKKTEEKQETCREKSKHVTLFVEMKRKCRDTLWGSQSQNVQDKNLKRLQKTLESVNGMENGKNKETWVAQVWE
jgi:hypothetical protein